MRSRDTPIQVLLIDAHTSQRQALEGVLLQVPSQGSGFQLETAAALEAGLKVIARGHVDVILLDLHLPDSRGIETFLKVNRTAPNIPIIILSDLPDNSLALAAIRRGAEDYLSKQDMHTDVIVRTIQFAVERHGLRHELEKANAQLERLSLTDPVTELFNRRGLCEILSHELQRARRKHSELLVLLVDLDDFKKINNVLGHNAGDVVLKEVAQKLKDSLRSTDYVGRIGGDEFMVLLPETRYAEGMHIAEKIRMAISTTLVSVSSIRDFKVTASLGLIPTDAADFTLSDPIGDMISNAHLLLHERKKSIKNQVLYDKKKLENGAIPVLSERLEEEEKFYALIQPIFRLTEGREAAYELLSRSLVKGLEMPDDFFRAAMESNILAKVDWQCLKACARAAATLPEGAFCHVNLFPSTLINLPAHNFSDLFQSMSKKVEFCIEISEQQILGDPSYLLDSVSCLRKAGIQIAIDDLGFGKSCLESLILLEPDIVKIDKKCVTGISGNGNRVRSLKRLVKMARSLDAEVIAEGIETQQDLELLKDLGIQFGQGFYLGKPKTVGAPLRVLGGGLLQK